MAYRKEKERVLAGSLNLVPPSDKVASPDSLELSNLRVDDAGQLRSRKGTSLIRATGTDPVHSLLRFNPDRFAGIGDGFYKGTTVENLLDSGFDGEPLGLAAYQNNVWVMNKSKRGRNWIPDYLSFFNWGIAAPTETPVATVGGTETVAVSEFDDVSEWDVTAYIDGRVLSTTQYDEPVYSDGKVDVVYGDTEVLGRDTNWQGAWVGMGIRIGADFYTTITDITGAGTLTIADAYPGSSGTIDDYLIYETNDLKSLDTSNKISGGGSLRLAATPAGSWRIRKEGSWNLLVDSTDKPGDLFQFWFYCQDQSALERLSVTMESPDQNGVTRKVTAKIPLPMVSTQLFSWTQLQITRGVDTISVIDANPEYAEIQRQIQNAVENLNDLQLANLLEQQRFALFETLISQTTAFLDERRVPGSADEQFDWSNVTAISFDFEINKPIDIHLDKAEFKGGVAANLVGDFSYYVTYRNDSGHESNPSPVSNTISLNRQSANVTIPAATDPQVTSRWLYRIGGGVNQPMRVAEIWGTDAVTWADRWSVASQSLEGIVMPEDNDLPPAASGLIGPYNGRLVAWEGNRMYYSEIARPCAWPGADDDFEGNWIDVGADGETILAMTQHRGSLWIYKERSIWRVDGDPDADGNDPRQTNANRSPVGKRAVVSAGSVDYYAAADGVYLFNGDYEEEISVKIRPIFRGETVEVASGISFVPINTDFAHLITLGFGEGKLYVSYPELGSETNNRTLVFEIATGRWAQYSTGYTAFANEGQKLIGGTAAGDVLLLEDGFSDSGSDIPIKWHSGYYDQGISDNVKMYADLVIVHNTAGASLTVSAVYNNSDVEACGTIQSTGRDVTIFPLGTGNEGREALNIAVRITGDASTAGPARIFDVYVHWYPLERKAKSFDTNVSDCGLEKFKQFDIVEAEITPTAAVTYKLYSDFPDRAVIQSSTGTFNPILSGRRQVQRTPIQMEGRRMRWTAQSAGAFQLHRLRVRFRAVGEYFNGAEGGFWESIPLRLGDLAQVKDYRIQYHADQGGTLKVYTDTPGGAMALRYTFPLPAETEWSALTTQVFQDIEQIECTLVKFRVDSPGPMRLYGCDFRYRPVGTFVTYGQIYETEPVFLGAVNQVFKLEVVLKNTASCAVTVTTELPQRALTVRHTETIAAGSRRPVEIRLPGTTRGELLRVRLTPDAGSDVSLYEVRAWCRNLGNESSVWRWVDMPLVKTPLEWQTGSFPIEGTSQNLVWYEFPVDAIE